MKICYQCEDRELACHDYCSEYQAFKRTIERARRKRSRDIDYTGYYLDAVVRMKTRR